MEYYYTVMAVLGSVDKNGETVKAIFEQEKL